MNMPVLPKSITMAPKRPQRMDAETRSLVQERIKQRLDELNITLRDASLRAPSLKSRLYELMQKDGVGRDITLSTLSGIADALECSVSWLTDGKRPPPPTARIKVVGSAKMGLFRTVMPVIRQTHIVGPVPTSKRLKRKELAAVLIEDDQLGGLARPVPPGSYALCARHTNQTRIRDRKIYLIERRLGDGIETGFWGALVNDNHIEFTALTADKAINEALSFRTEQPAIGLEIKGELYATIQLMDEDDDAPMF